MFVLVRPHQVFGQANEGWWSGLPVPTANSRSAGQGGHRRPGRLWLQASGIGLLNGRGLYCVANTSRPLSHEVTGFGLNVVAGADFAKAL